MNDIELLRRARPDDVTVTEAAREELLAELRALPDLAPARRPARRRFAAVAAACAAVPLAGGGLAYAVLRQQPATTLVINCAATTTEAEFDSDPHFTEAIAAATTDPVADCAAQWDELGRRAPTLAAYDTGDAYVSVVPASWKVPDTWHLLPGTFRTDPQRLALQQRLSDLVDGPEGTCSSAEAAEQYAREQVADLGLQGYTVRRLDQAGLADGKTGCALAWVDERGAAEVLLQGEPRQGPPASGLEAAEHELGRLLRARISDTCVPLPQARALTRAAVTEAGFDKAPAVHEAADPGARCTSVDVVRSATSSEVYLTGPAS